jgi:hypothetical protein
MPVEHEPREQPCSRCGRTVSARVIRETRPRDNPTRQESVHDDDGTPADDDCRR